MPDFSQQAKNYAEKAFLQKSASARLLALLNILSPEDVLDLGCGPGHITQEIARRTGGQVVGVDPSAGMIKEAQAKNTVSNLRFEMSEAEALSAVNSFDVIFCNSALQWFSDPEEVVKRCFRALKPKGRMGLQAPATQNYCPLFRDVEKTALAHPLLANTFQTFHSPWFFLERAEDYVHLFLRAGFQVDFAEIVNERSLCSADEAYRFFQSGAENAYLNQNYYTQTLPAEYPERFRAMVRSRFQAQLNPDGLLDLRFYRIYLLAHKD